MAGTQARCGICARMLTLCGHAYLLHSARLLGLGGEELSLPRPNGEHQDQRVEADEREPYAKLGEPERLHGLVAVDQEHGQVDRQDLVLRKAA